MPDSTSTPDPIVTPFYLDKALWVTVLTPLLAFLASKLGISLDPVAIVGLVLPIVAYIVMHKWKTATLQAATIAGAQAVAAAQGQDPAVGLAAPPKP